MAWPLCGIPPAIFGKLLSSVSKLSLSTRRVKVTGKASRICSSEVKKKEICRQLPRKKKCPYCTGCNVIIIPNGDRSSPYKTQCEENSCKSTLLKRVFLFSLCEKLPQFRPFHLCGSSQRFGSFLGFLALVPRQSASDQGYC